MRFLLAAAALLACAVPITAGLSAAVPGPDGETLFRQRCQSCHSVTPGVTSPLAPNLAGVLGRKAAATGFNYTPALRASGLTWSRANLDRFLAAPPRLVPGTGMATSLPDPRQRAAIIDFLAHTGH